LTTASSPSRSDWRLSPDDGEVLSGAFDEDAGELSLAGDAGEISGAPDGGAVTSLVEMSSAGGIQVLPILWDQQELMSLCVVRV